ncbi:hypothetical protein V8D89_014272 [Ganoderma adspersum]
MDIDADSQEALQERIVDYYANTELFNYTDLAVFVVIVFEHVMTFDREVHFAWGCKPSWARCIFLLNRYLSIMEYLVVLGPLLPTVNTFSCVFLTKLMQILQVILYIVWAAFSGTRIYAISARNRSVTSVVVFLALVPAVTNAYVITATPVAVTPDGCMSGMDFSVITWITLSVATRSCMIVSDAIVIIVTWIKTWSTIRIAKRLRVQMSFTSLVLKEGILYFCIALSLNIVQIVFDFVEVGRYSLILPFLNVFTPVLVSRFFLDLDDLSAHDRGLPWISSSGVDHKGISSTLHFLDPGSVTSTYSPHSQNFEVYNSEGDAIEAKDVDFVVAGQARRPSETLQV